MYNALAAIFHSEVRESEFFDVGFQGYTLFSRIGFFDEQVRGHQVLSGSGSIQSEVRLVIQTQVQVKISTGYCDQPSRGCNQDV